MSSKRTRPDYEQLLGELREHLAMMVRYLEEETRAGDGIPRDELVRALRADCEAYSEAFDDRGTCCDYATAIYIEALVDAILCGKCPPKEPKR